MLTRPAFTHDGTGTSAEVWSSDPRWADRAPLSLDGVRRLVVVAAHPDDESLGAGGLLATAHERGIDVELVLLTAGELSHPMSPTHSRERLALRRVGEAKRALAAVAPTAALTRLALGDGSVAESEHAVAAKLVDLIGDGADTLVAAPWRHDGHPDHEAAGRAASVAARRTDATLVEYPVWWWHWATPSEAPWDGIRRLDLTDAARSRKDRAIAAHTSQVLPLSEHVGDEALLQPAFLAHFHGPVEVYVVEDGEDAALDDLRRAATDPWGIDDRWYEQRKRDLTLSVLPRRTFGRGLEIGCSTGALSARLAERCDDLLAVDSSPVAVAAARLRLADTGVRVELMHPPSEWPDGELDLVVVSEMAHFLSPRELRGLVERVRASLAPYGVVVLCHWRHRIDGWVPNAGQVLRAFTDGRGLSGQATYRDRDVEIVLLGASDVLPVPTA
ncbi:bifunctional PIG-L family deacetylase/class I SAM-dependent methyltransferase [Nocardioides sp. URHA0020]|uniref:bifunctional PIG-L family deacetylase/class I SAM-dependent methyltransferase n=1 Tax=Nocardioides sp. URHA0020 TaxID=1380392 RepID=UPI0006861796|nr:bifunctional PIG-L family deacetylase/class I SAM-dependent methyltransferase [Nocardioides sp. URHA0020]